MRFWRDRVAELTFTVNGVMELGALQMAMLPTGVAASWCVVMGVTLAGVPS